jgi:hypothetical protein
MAQRRKLYWPGTTILQWSTPLESIGKQQKGTITIEPSEFDDAIDKAFKPGLWQ